MTHDSDAVGYRSPPKSTRFRPGQSGNPAGRPKGLRSIANELRDILAEEIATNTGGEIRRITKQRALASGLVTAAIEGDLRATAIVLSHVNRGPQAA